MNGDPLFLGKDPDLHCFKGRRRILFSQWMDLDLDPYFRIAHSTWPIGNRCSEALLLLSRTTDTDKLIFEVPARWLHRQLESDTGTWYKECSFFYPKGIKKKKNSSKLTWATEVKVEKSQRFNSILTLTTYSGVHTTYTIHTEE